MEEGLLVQLTLLHMGELWDERFGGETSLYLTVCESKDMPIKGKLCYKPPTRNPIFLGPRDTPDFHLRLIMPFHDLAFKVLQAHGRCKGGADGLQVRLQCCGLSRE